jgi:hypothetical protein
VAGVVAAVAAGTAAEALDRGAAPALIAARAQALLIGLLRLALAAGAVAVVVVRGVDLRVALELCALGAGLLVFAVLAGSRRRGERGRLDEAALLVGPASVVSHARALARATYPSTIGLTATTAIALAARPPLAALLAGILAGLGALALVAAAELALWERRRGGRVLTGTGPGGRVFLQRG